MMTTPQESGLRTEKLHDIKILLNFKNKLASKNLEEMMTGSGPGVLLLCNQLLGKHLHCDELT